MVSMNLVAMAAAALSADSIPVSSTSSINDRPAQQSALPPHRLQHPQADKAMLTGRTYNPQELKDSLSDSDSNETLSELSEVGGGLSERAATPQSEDDDTLALVDKYAFNFTREAYDHKFAQKLTIGVKIYVKRLAALTLPLKQHRKEIKDKDGAADIVPPLVPHRHELDSDPQAVECIWVGILPNSQIPLEEHAEDITVSEGNSKKKSKKLPPIAISKMCKEELSIIDFDRNALRVVAKMSDKATKDAHLFALVNPQGNKQCIGYKVAYDDLFYFRKFCDNTTKTIVTRKQATITMLKACFFAAADLASSASKAPASKAHSGPKRRFVDSPRY
ncbi:unnamed protein product [Discula destructiva]